MFRTILASLALATALTGAAQAATVAWSASLDQSQEFPAPMPVSTATGSASGTLDTVSGLLGWAISWAGLSGAPVGLHFHANAGPGVNAPVVVHVGDISGLTSPSVGSATIPLPQIDNFLAGLYYINIHTALNPGGEIRGQVTVDPVPLPAAAPMALAGLAALGALRLSHKRRRAVA